MSRRSEIVARLEAGERSFEGLDLVGADLSDLDLIAVRWNGADLRRADLRGSRLIDACFLDADLRRARLDGAALLRADFRRVDARGASFVDADASRVDFHGADLRLADFSGAELEGASIPLDCRGWGGVRYSARAIHGFAGLFATIRVAAPADEARVRQAVDDLARHSAYLPDPPE